MTVWKMNTRIMKKSTDIGSWVLEKNNQFIAFNKPAGIPVQEDKTGDTSLLRLAEIYTKKKILLCNRIDRPASGIVLFAKNKTALEHINKQFQFRTIDKTYLCIVETKPPKDSDSLTNWIEKNGKANKSFIVPEKTARSTEARLDYKLIGSSDRYFLMEVQLHTGKHHQIRCQLAHIGSIIKGDVKYGARRSNKDKSIHLHAWKTIVTHPISKKKIMLKAPLPAEDSLWSYFKKEVLAN